MLDVEACVKREMWIVGFMDYWIVGFMDYWIGGFMDCGLLDRAESARASDLRQPCVKRET
jgi:hypothetical protein